MPVFIPIGGEASPIYTKFRLKFSASGQQLREEVIGTYTRRTVRVFDFEREWTWDRVPIKLVAGTGSSGSPFFTESFPDSGAIRFFSGLEELAEGTCYISMDTSRITDGDAGIPSTATFGGIGSIPDIHRPGEFIEYADTDDQFEVIGEETITYTGTGAPANPAPTEIMRYIAPAQLRYTGNIDEAFWGVGFNHKYDITNWGIGDWMDKRSVFSAAYNEPSDGWDESDVMTTWEWELS